MQSLAQGHTTCMGFGQDSKQAGWIPGLSSPTTALYFFTNQAIFLVKCEW